MRRVIPWIMVWGRALLSPLLVVGAWKDVSGRVLAAIVLIGLADDIADGILARRWGCETAALRLADSVADTVFYLGTAGAVWLRTPQLLRHDWKLLALLFGFEGLRYVLDFWKFGKGASYHSYLAKLWGLVLASAMVGALAANGPQWLVTTAIVMGVVTNLEGLTMSLMLPQWQNDVKTVRSAWRIRAALERGA